MKYNIDENLSRMKIKPLTKEEREKMWQHIVTAAHQPLGTSRFILKEFIRKPLIWGTMIGILILGGSMATVSAADNAKPGDLLFSIDRALESVQLALASSNQQKTQLKLGIVQERLEEIQAILAENETDDIEDEEENTEANFSIDEEQIDQAFDIALSSIADIKQEFEDQGNTDAVSAINKVIDEFDTDFQSLPSKFRFSIKQNRNKYQLTLEIQTSEGKERLRIKTNGNKVDIDLKNEDGKIKIKIKEDGSVKVKDKKRGKDENEEDTTPPVISFIAASTTASTTATIIWTTDETTDSTVAYGTSTPVTTDPPFILVSDTSLVENHSIELVDLDADTVYNFIVISKDAAGNETVSGEDSFTTPSL